MTDSGSCLDDDSAVCAKSACIAVTGELTVARLASFRQVALDAFEHAGTLVLDMQRAEYLDAAALQCLDALRREAAQRGVSLRIDKVPAEVCRVAALLGMTAVMDDYRTEVWK